MPDTRSIVEVIGLISALSDIPRWLRLKFPVPRVSIANCFLPSSANASLCFCALAGLNITSSPPVCPTLGSVELLFLFCTPVTVIELVNEFAAVCAALNMELKNPPAPIGDVRVPPGVLTSSSAGVRGAETALESLLG
jgi:hypothetical protein